MTQADSNAVSISDWIWNVNSVTERGADGFFLVKSKREFEWVILLSVSQEAGKHKSRNDVLVTASVCWMRMDTGSTVLEKIDSSLHYPKMDITWRDVDDTATRDRTLSGITYRPSVIPPSS